MSKSAEVKDFTENVLNADEEKTAPEAEAVTDSDVSADPPDEKAAPKKRHRRSKRAADSHRAATDKKEIHLPGQQHLLFREEKYIKKDSGIKSSIEHQLLFTYTTVLSLRNKKKRAFSQNIHVKR